MARHKKAAATSIVRYLPTAPSRTPAPVVRIMAPRAPAASKKRGKAHGRRSDKGGGLSMTMLGGTALGGAALGFVEKQWPNAPTLPLLGRAGTIALAAYFFGGKSKPGLMRDIAIAGAVVAGYELGKTGKIAGDDVLGDVSPQIGISAQV